MSKLWIRLLIGLLMPVGSVPQLEAAEKLQVVTTIFPVYDFARQIGGDLADVTLLLPPGVEAHSFAPTPRDVVNISKADIFVYTGQYMEPWAEDLLQGIENPNLRIIDASTGIALAGEPESDAHAHEGAEHAEADDDQHRHGSVDPHIWLDPLLAQQMVQTIADGFAASDAAHAEVYQRNARSYTQQLAELDADIRQMLLTCKHPHILYGGHFAFGYFVRRYGLNYTSPYEGFSPNAQPNPKNIAELIDKMRATGGTVIYYEELLDPRVARTIAAETGADMLLLHGGHNVSRTEQEQGVTYLTIMRQNLTNLKIGLECQE